MTFKKNYIPWNKGKTFKHGSGLRKICPVCGIEFKARIYSVNCSRACRNKANPIDYTEQRRIEHSEACKGINSGANNPAYGKYGKDSWAFGTKRTPEQREKMSVASKGKNSGEKNHNWQGGKSFEPYPLGWTNTFKEQIRYRDGYRCQECGVPEVECNKKLHVHHKDRNKKNLNIDNLISLCGSCHINLHHRLRKELKCIEKS